MPGVVFRSRLEIFAGDELTVPYYFKDDLVCPVSSADADLTVKVLATSLQVPYSRQVYLQILRLLRGCVYWEWWYLAVFTSMDFFFSHFSANA
jgi:hypothetical protein